MTELVGPIHVVGSGLLGTSVGLAASRAGLEVWLTDANHEHVRTASGLGAGILAPAEGVAQLTVVAVPPDHIAESVVEALERGGVVTDVGSVKTLPFAQISDHVDEDLLACYVGSHPMAGSERSGPLAATAALFDGRPWAITPHVHSAPERGPAGRGAGPAVRRRAGSAHPGRARPGRRPHVAPAAPARRTHRRAARRGPAGAPVAVRAGRARRDQDRRRRPGHVDARSCGPTTPRWGRSCATCRPTSPGWSTSWRTATRPRSRRSSPAG